MVSQVRNAAEDAQTLTKMYFSCMEDSAYADALRATERKQAVIAGMEAHICVVQTAESFGEKGSDAIVVHDSIALRTLRRTCAHPTFSGASRIRLDSAESIAFECPHGAGKPAFKEPVPLITQQSDTGRI